MIMSDLGPDYVSPESQATQEVVNYLAGDVPAEDQISYPASPAMLAAEEAELGPIELADAELEL
jgi:hypothetical protein